MITLDRFKECLDKLDELLDERKFVHCPDPEHMEPMTIKAIGGFALLYYDIRSMGYTNDIDTVTLDYSDWVLDCIEEIAVREGLPLNWINNDTVYDGDVEIVDQLIGAVWIESSFKLNNIKLYVAGLATLFQSKLIASEDDNLTKRDQDFPDLVDILKQLGCVYTNDVFVLARGLDINIRVEYPRNYKRIFQTFPKPPDVGTAYAGSYVFNRKQGV